MNLKQMRVQCAIKQKRGLHFILTSILIWILILIAHLSPLPITTKNLLTFMSSTLLLPLSYLLSKWLKIDFQNKNNPLSKLGLMITMNQMPYLLIPMYLYNSDPTKMVMVLAMIFGAHLLLYSWVYLSLSYFFFSIIIPIVIFLVGLTTSPVVVCIVMIVFEILFSISLIVENKEFEKFLKS